MYYEKSINNSETGIQMDLFFENGCEGKINLDISYTGKQNHVLEFVGEEGSVILENNTAKIIDGFELLVNNLRKIQNHVPKILMYGKFDESEDPRIKNIYPLGRRFIDWCNNGIKTKPDFKDGLRVQELIEKTREFV